MPKKKGIEPREGRIVNPTGVGRAVPGEPDRVWITLERKCRVAQYESLTVNLGAAVACLPDESVREAHRRLLAELKPEFDEVLELMRKEAGI